MNPKASSSKTQAAIFRMYQEEKQKANQKEFWLKQKTNGTYLDVEGGISNFGGSSIALGQSPSMTAIGHAGATHAKGKPDSRASTMAASNGRPLNGDMKVQDIILEIEENKRKKKKKKVLTWIYDGV